MRKVQQTPYFIINLLYKTINWFALVFLVYASYVQDAQSAVIYGGKSVTNQPGELVTISLPLGTSAGDLLVAMVVLKSGAAANPAGSSAGWTELDWGLGEGTTVSVGVWWKSAGASEPDATFTWVGPSFSYALMMRFTGHDPSNNVISLPAFGASDTPSSPTVTSTVAESLILRLGGFNKSILTGVPAGHTPITPINSGTVTAAAYIYQSAIGPSGSSNFTLGSAKAFRTLTLAIAPAVSGLPAASSAVAEISPNNVTTSSTNVSFNYDIDPTIGIGTGVDQVGATF